MAFSQYASMNNAPQGAGMPQQQQFGGPMFNVPAVSPEMLNIGLSAGQDMLNKQRDKWMPGVSGFWNALKIYFGVNTIYVIAKLKNILYPFQNKAWNRIPSESYSSEGDASTRKWSLPKHDVNAPDLYIPAMAFISYILLCGLMKGLGVGSGTFSPDIIIQAIWKCLIVQVCESFIIKFGLSLIGFTIPFWDVFSYTGYKYVGLCVNIFARVLGSTMLMLAALYTSAMFAIFIMKTFASVVPKSATNNTSIPRHFIILAFSGLELVVALFLSWL